MVDHQKVTERRISYIKFPCTRCNFCFVEETSEWFDEREKQHKRRAKNCDSNNGIYKHLEKNPDHIIVWDKATIPDYERNYYASRMKESIYIDLFAKTGSMNLEDGMKKNHSWSAIMPMLRKEIL
jgi:hypothetical protein